MNLPNKITLTRVCFIPIFMIFYLVPMPSLGEVTITTVEIPVSHMIGALIFIIASLTDWIDGYLARKYNLVTNLGKFLDPLADKLLVTAAFVMLVQIGSVPAWVAIVILSREFAVTGLRTVAAAEGAIIAASPLGKLKTWTQMIALSVLLLHNIPFAMWNIPFDQIMLYLATIITIISGVDYFVKNKEVVLKSK
ncbi:MAG TPA: CDP-diacylglycerol--glycerol-3-phosphate 3-phosphatidyltransferase [Massilibacterium sp.]|nr:CDP-diacylglycerol--glycerol-3-phosphate 3-phosphatidyltransferase [Massilibacterium sp.]